MYAVSQAQMREGHYTPGMGRREAFAHDGTWAGSVTMEPHTASGWHHHAGNSSYIYVRTGRVRVETSDGKAVDCGPGDFIFVAPEEVHREVNPAGEPSEVILFRVGSGEFVVNVDG